MLHAFKTVRLLAALLACAALAAGAAYALRGRLASNDFYARSLLAAGADSAVEIGGETYAIQNGAVYGPGERPVPSVVRSAALKLAYAREMALRNPIYSLEGTDLDALRSAIYRLADAGSDLAASQTDATDQARVDRLYPIEFLTAIADAEAGRRALLKETSWENKRAYEIALAHAAQLHAAAARAYAKDFDAIESPHFSYALPSGVITKESTLAAVRALESSTARMPDEVRRRARCSAGFVALCSTSDLTIHEPAAPAREDTASSMPESVRWALDVRSRAEDDAAALRDTFFAMPDTTCTGSFPAPNFYAIHEPTSLFPFPREAWYAGDALFIDVSAAASQRDAETLRYMEMRGVSYLPLHPMTFYMCPNAPDTAGALFSLEEALRRAQSGSLPMPSISSGHVSPLRVIDGSELTRAFTQLAAGNRSSRAPAERDAIISTTVMLENKTAGFEHLVEQIAHVEEWEVSMKRAGAPIDLSPQRLFSTQSGFPSILLAYNASVFRNSESYSIVDRAQATPPAHILSWSRLRDSVSMSKIVEDTRLFFLMHNDPEAFARLAR